MKSRPLMPPLFQAGGALPATHPTYSVRSGVDAVALAALFDGRMIHVIAPRQVGKTSLLLRLKARVEDEGWRCAIIDLSVLMDFSAQQWYQELGNILERELSLSVKPVIRDQVDLNFFLSQDIFEQNPQYERIVLLFDEVEGVIRVGENHDARFSDAFFLTLRDLQQRQDRHKGRLAIGIAGAVGPDKLIRDPDISPFNISNPINMNDFSLHETLTLTHLLTNLSTQVEEEVHTRIYDWTQGHPYLTHRICQGIEQRLHDQPQEAVSSALVDELVAKIFFEGSYIERDTNISHVERLLNYLPAPAHSIWQHLIKDEHVSYDSIDKPTFMELYLTGAIAMRSGQLEIRNRIYRQLFLQVPRPLPETGQHCLSQEDRSYLREKFKYLLLDFCLSPRRLREIMLAGQIPRSVVDRVNSENISSDDIESLLSFLECGGELRSQRNYHMLGAFLSQFIMDDDANGFGYDVYRRFAQIIEKYPLIRDAEVIAALQRRLQDE